MLAGILPNSGRSLMIRGCKWLSLRIFLSHVQTHVCSLPLCCGLPAC